jgi:hypothetical protein
MDIGRSVFAQLMGYFPRYQFQARVDRYHGNDYVKSFLCWDQFLCMAFAQLTCRESLRDLETRLPSMRTWLYDAVQ